MVVVLKLNDIMNDVFGDNHWGAEQSDSEDTDLPNSVTNMDMYVEFDI